MRNMETRITEQLQTMLEGSERSMRRSEGAAALLRYVEGYEISRPRTTEPQYQDLSTERAMKRTFKYFVLGMYASILPMTNDVSNPVLLACSPQTLYACTQAR